jgi:hypothetical protein
MVTNSLVELVTKNRRASKPNTRSFLNRENLRLFFP